MKSRAEQGLLPRPRNSSSNICDLGVPVRVFVFSHAELQAKGVVGREEHRAQVLVPRQDLTGADRIWAARYNPGDVLRYSRGSKETSIGKGEYARVKSVDAPNNRLTVERKSGEEVSYDPRRATP